MPTTKARTEYGTFNVTAACGEHDGWTFGVFYKAGTGGGARHIRRYQPYHRPPGVALCGDVQPGVSPATRSVDNLCPACAREAQRIFGELQFQ